MNEVCTQDLKPKTDLPPEDGSAPQPRAGFLRKVAVKQPAQPVLQNPGYGSSGGVQVSICDRGLFYFPFVVAVRLHSCYLCLESSPAFHDLLFAVVATPSHMVLWQHESFVTSGLDPTA